jgi:group I intron endonuclease
MTCGIYKITNTVNGKIYVGSSVDTVGRFNVHRSDLRANKHGNSYLQNAWNKYGESAFVFEVIEQCEPGSVRDVEQRYLDELFAKSDRESFYNLYDKASGISSEIARQNNLKRWSDPGFKAKASESFKKVWSNPELIARHKEACKDSIKKIADIELWKKNLIEAHNTDEYKTKASERVKKQWQNPDIRSKMMNSLTSEQYKIKQSKAVKKAFQDPETKRKHSEGIKKSFTPQRRENLSKFAKEFFSSTENRDQQRLNNPLRKPIRCKETGIEYASIAQAAKEIGVAVKTVKKATLPGRTCKGLTFEYVDRNKYTSDGELNVPEAL